MKTKFNFLLIISILTFFCNCVGENGAIGPQGATGPQGAKGDKGEKGSDGAVPKTRTGIFSVKISDWKKASTFTTNDSYYVIVPVPAITKDVLEKGILNVWMSRDTPFEDPYMLPNDISFGQMIYMSYLEKGEGRLRIDLYPGIGRQAAFQPNGEWSFKWMINL